VTPFGDKLIKATKDLSGNIKVETITSVRYGDLVIPSEAEIKAAQLIIDRKKASTVIVPPNQLAQDFGRLVNCEEFSDVTFLVEDLLILEQC